MIEWVRSSFCEATACVEVSFQREAVWVRSSERGQGSVILARPEWDAFIAGVKNGEFDPPGPRE